MELSREFSCMAAPSFEEVLIWECFSFHAVKFRIKSFRVPDLFVEIPENATVGSLKACESVTFKY